MPSVTIRDVARYAGVGVATVSRVLNDNQNVRADTRERVLQAIDSLNYTPNLAARQLSGGKTMVIGVVTPYLTIPSFSERLAGIQRVLWDSRYDLVLHSVRSPENLEGKLRRLLRQKRIDGTILLSPPPLDKTLWDINPDMPIIVLDSPHTATGHPTIMIDDQAGGEMVARYLLQIGHQRIGFVGDELESIFGETSNKRRFDGFQATLAMAGLDLPMKWCRFGEMGSDTARRQAWEILSQAERPTAVFASSDVKAFDVINVAREMNLRVPQDLAVIGFDDIEAAHYMQLTTVRQYLHATGVQAADLILAWVRDDRIPEQAVYQRSVDIVVRNTT
jgi:DNA-binding LacI/PurR family transcriptional regulator